MTTSHKGTRNMKCRSTSRFPPCPKVLAWRSNHLPRRGLPDSVESPGLRVHTVLIASSTLGRCEHHLSLGGTNRVQVNVHRQAWQIEDKQVQSCTALECQPPAEKRWASSTMNASRYYSKPSRTPAASIPTAAPAGSCRSLTSTPVGPSSRRGAGDRIELVEVAVAEVRKRQMVVLRRSHAGCGT